MFIVPWHRFGPYILHPLGDSELRFALCKPLGIEATSNVGGTVG